MKLKHEGFHTNRLKPEQNNPREVVFAQAWKEENGYNSNLGLLGHLIPEVTQRDAYVAATIIQWLGSSVGQGFLQEVIKKEPRIKEFLLR